MNKTITLIRTVADDNLLTSLPNLLTKPNLKFNSGPRRFYFFFACQRSTPKLAKLLLERGADPEVVVPCDRLRPLRAACLSPLLVSFAPLNVVGALPYRKRGDGQVAARGSSRTHQRHQYTGPAFHDQIYRYRICPLKVALVAALDGIGYSKSDTYGCIELSKMLLKDERLDLGVMMSGSSPFLPRITQGERALWELSTSVCTDTLADGRLIAKMIILRFPDAFVPSPHQNV